MSSGIVQWMVSTCVVEHGHNSCVCRLTEFDYTGAMRTMLQALLHAYCASSLVSVYSSTSRTSMPVILHHGREPADSIQFCPAATDDILLSLPSCNTC